MARDKKREAAPARPFNPLGGWKWLIAAAFVLALFYFTPLLSSNATIQWDAVDVHYPSQWYFAGQVRHGHLPQWAPYIFSGFPFLADPQVGAFYPLNWPFFLAGITPGAIEAELALHSLIALCGAFFLMRRLTGNVAASLTGALAYALGGFFAGHSSHVGMFQGAALLPWLLYCFDRALEASPARWISLSAGVAGCIMLAGHMQTAMYALMALALFAAWRVIELRSLWRRAVIGLAAAAALSGALAAVLILPAMELTDQSIRATMDFSKGVEGTLPVGALGTLVYPDALGVLSGQYRGGVDMTQSYYYAGILLLPLAAFALRRRAAAILAALLVAVPVWYMLGPSAGLYHLGAVLPFLHKMRAPVNGWFVAALGLSVLAAMGAAEAEARWKKAWLGLALLAVFAIDLCHFNSWSNPLTYGRISYFDMYGPGQRALEGKMSAALLPGYRLHLQDRFQIFGPMNSPLLAQVETTYGYNPLELAAYRDYRKAAESNHRLVDGLAVALEVLPKEEKVAGNQTALKRVMITPQVIDVSTEEQSRARLADLDPKEQSVVLGPHDPVQQDPQAKTELKKLSEGSLTVSYTAASPSLLRMAEVWYPGWEARVDGKPVKVLRVNHALMGAVVPAGTHEVVFEYKPTRFGLGAAISGVALVLLVVGISWREKREGALDEGVAA